MSDLVQWLFWVSIVATGTCVGTLAQWRVKEWALGRAYAAQQRDIETYTAGLRAQEAANAAR